MSYPHTGISDKNPQLRCIHIAKDYARQAENGNNVMRVGCTLQLQVQALLLSNEHSDVLKHLGRCVGHAYASWKAYVLIELNSRGNDHELHSIQAMHHGIRAYNSMYLFSKRFERLSSKIKFHSICTVLLHSWVLHWAFNFQIRSQPSSFVQCLRLRFNKASHTACSRI